MPCPRRLRRTETALRRQRRNTYPPSKGGGVIPLKTTAPPEVYRSYINKRKGTVERIPEGVQPGFNYSLRTIDRKSILLNILAKKTEMKHPDDLENVINSFLSSNINKTDFYNFVDNALKNKRKFPVSSPVGFFDEKITRFLKNKK
jgi:hypothetical protein